ISHLHGNALEKLFNEELGAVIQVKKSDTAGILKKLGKHAHIIGQPIKLQEIVIADKHETYAHSRAQLESWWSDTSYQIQKLRDNPAAAKQEFKALQADADPGLSPVVSTVYTQSVYTIPTPPHPQVAIF